MLNEGGTNNDGGGSNNWSRVCDRCRSAPCIIYCRADSAYLCRSCDGTIHAANRVASRHERVWVCDACERAPAAFLCKADAASLCASCDADIHNANPLASRHQRVPILPITGALLGDQGFEFEVEEEVIDEEGDEAEAASWLLSNPVRNGEEEENQGLLFDEYLDLVDCCNSCGDNQFGNFQYEDHQHQNHNQNHQQHDYVTVPPNFAVVQCGGREARADHVQLQPQHFQPGFDFDSSKAAFSYDGSVTQISVSSMDVGVVPESTMSDIDISISHSKSQLGTSDLFGPIPMAHQFSPMDREARVLRYREKKKTRKFEKKIRYASRKAYAETRPRVKGRFAKRTDVEAEVDEMLSTSLTTETGCIVPSF